MTDELYSNCVILDFPSPITKAQLDRIKNVVNSNRATGIIQYPMLHAIVCGERASGADLGGFSGNCVVPTIAADEC